MIQARRRADRAEAALASCRTHCNPHVIGSCRTCEAPLCPICDVDGICDRCYVRACWRALLSRDWRAALLGILRDANLGLRRG